MADQDRAEDAPRGQGARTWWPGYDMKHPEVTERRPDERDGDAVVIEVEGPPIVRCQSRYSWNVKCVKPPHGPDDPWHTDGGAVHWHTDAEVGP